MEQKPQNYIDQVLAEFDEKYCYKDERDGKMKLHGMVSFADNYKSFIRTSLEGLVEELDHKIKVIITDEMIIARSPAGKTSRLTSAFNRISALLNEYGGGKV